jgi:endonuclease/exonuclease/phosphatase family metal-dependent hydrolase
VRLASLNLLHGRADVDAVVALVRERAVDLLVLVELPDRTRRRLHAAGLDDLLPSSAVLAARQGREDSWGAGVWSRLPAEPAGAVPGFSSQPTLRPTVPGAPAVEVSAVHSHPPVWTPWTVPQWESDLADLGAPRPDVVRLLAGDLNATPDHRAFRDVLDRGWTDAARATGAARRTTWTPLHAPQPRLVLDHVLVDPRVGVASFDVVRVRGTDHRALVADLVLPAA